MNILKKIDPKEIADITGLSPVQEGMLYHYLKDPDGDLYFEQLSLRIHGDIGPKRFKRAWNAVVKANDVLRTQFRWEGVKNPLQIILKEWQLEPVFHDLSGHDNPQSRESALKKIKQNDRSQPFDLNRVPFRITLCKIENRCYEMIISNHHILYDGWSNRVILTEFFSAYHESSRKKSFSPTAKAQYKEFISWLRQRDPSQHREFWRTYLANFQGSPGLAVKRAVMDKGNAKAIHAAQEEKDDIYSISFSGSFKEELERYIKAHKMTLSTIFYAAWGVSMQRYNNSPDIIFGTTVSGRSADIEGIEDIAGLFINTIPLRIRTMPGDHAPESALSFLTRIDNELRRRETFESTSLVEIKEYGGIAIDGELFDNIVVIENYPLDGIFGNISPGLSIASHDMVERTHYDLTVAVTPRDGIEVEFSFSHGKFDKAIKNALPNHFAAVLKTLVENPGQPVDHIEIISAREKETLLHRFNDTYAGYPRDKTIHGLFEEQAARFPHRTALVASGSYLTYGELDRRSQRLAAMLKEKGLFPGTIAAIKMQRSMEMVIGLLAILKAGAAYLPVSPKYPPERIRFMLADSAAAVTIEQGTVSDSFYFQTTAAAAAPVPKPSSHSPAYIIYTSGTTGKPKGVVVEHSAVVNRVFWVKERYRLDQRDIVLQATSFVFDVSVCELFRWIPAGGRLCLPAPGAEKDPVRITRVIARNNVTTADFIPAMLTLLLDYIRQANLARQLSSLRWVWTGVEVVGANLVEQFNNLLHPVNGARLINAYGPTESTVDITYFDCTNHIPGQKVPIGRPMANIRTHILSRTGTLQPIGVPGELCVSGLGLARGYLNRPELTSEKFPPLNAESSSPLEKDARSAEFVSTDNAPRFYHTGDLVKWLPDGNIRFLGRIDQQVKIRGYRVEPGEIESCLLARENVRDALVIVRQPQGMEKYLCAYITSSITSNGPIDTHELKSQLADELPAYMVPDYILQLEAIPLNAAGNVDREALPEPGAQTDPGSGSFTPPAGPVQEKLAAIWAELLKREQSEIGTNHDFFKMGGHSLNAIQLISRINRAFAVEVPLLELFDSPTIAGLARCIHRLKEQPETSAGEKSGSRFRRVRIEAAEKRQYYPLSSAQRRLFVLQEIDPASTAYNMPSAWTLKGNLDKSRLENAFKQLIQHHESLRTSFISIDGEPVQRIHSHVPFSISRTQDTVRPFDLSRPPLLRVSLEQSGDSHRLIVDMHHIISDGLSIDILLKDFIPLYNGSTPSSWETNQAITYKDYALWINSPAHREKLRGQADFWLSQFKREKLRKIRKIRGQADSEADSDFELSQFNEELPVLDLPQDFPRPPVQDFAGDEFHFTIGPTILDALKTIAGQTGSTLFMVLLAAYLVLLDKLGNRRDILVGVPAAGRDSDRLQHIIGLFVNTLALRFNSPGKKTFTQFLNHVREKSIQAFENQDYPYEHLVEQLNLNRDAGRNPLFDTMFILQNPDARQADIPGLTVTPHLLQRRTSKFDLTLECTEKDGKLSCLLEYSTAIFKGESIERFSKYFTNIAAAIAKDDEAPVHTIDMIPAEEKKRLLHTFNDTSESFPTGKTIHGFIEAHAASTPDRIICSMYEGPGGDNLFVTYKEMDQRANALARHLYHRESVRPGQPIAVSMERSIPLITALIGIMKAGGAYVPLDPSLPIARLRLMLNDASATVAVSQTKFMAKLSPLLSQCPALHTLLDLEDPGNGIDRHADSAPVIKGNHHPAYVMYTSGSSGTPKGVLVEHRTIANTLMWRKNYYRYSAGDVSLRNPPYFFDSSVTDIFTPLLGGAQLLLAPEDRKTDLPALANAILYNHVSHFIAVPAFYNVLLEEISYALVRVKHICVAGEHFPDELIRKHYETLPQVRIHNEYGPTENSVNTTAYPIEPGSQKALIGKPISNVQVYVLDPNLQLCPTGVTGEMCLAGSSLARGYLNNPELTAERFVNYKLQNTNYKQSQFRIYRTGDMARWLPGGNLEFMGRLDNQVKIRGIRVETGEIRNHLMSCQHVKDALVLAHKTPGRDTFLCAYIVLQPGVPVIDLNAFLAEKLPGYMIPAYFINIDEIPFTATGKIDRSALPVPQPQEDTIYVQPRNKLEQELAEIWAAVLDMDTAQIGIDHNFFQLGGHSLKATRLTAHIHKKLGITLPLRDIFKTPHIRGLAASIKNLIPSTASGLTTGEKKEYYQLSSSQKRLFILHQMEETGTGTGYNIPSAWTLTGAIDKARIRGTFEKLIQRHQSLRTSFHVLNGYPIQRIHETVDFEIGPSSKPIGSSGPIPPQLRRFDLSRAPLLRVELLPLEQDKHLLFLDIHHIISDGVSVFTLIHDFNRLYRGQSLPMPRFQYTDYCRWQRRPEQRDKIREQEPYWLNRFRNPAPVLSLPTDFPRPLVQSLEGRSVFFRLDNTHTRGLKNLARQENVTLFMVLLSIYNILLSKLAGQEDIVIGTPIAGRRHADLEAITGMFVNTLALRNFPAGEKSFNRFLAEVKTHTIDAFDNQDYPFEELLTQNHIAIQRDAGRNPLFDAMFSLQNFDVPQIEISGLTVTPYPFENKISTFDLTLTVREDQEGLHCEFEYSRHLFKPRSIGRFTGYFLNIADAVIRGRDEPLAAIDIMGEEERRRLLYDFNLLDRQYPTDKSLAQLFEEQAARTPDTVALTGPKADGSKERSLHLSYSQLDHWAALFAGRLREEGVRHGSLVGLMTQRSVDLIIAMLAIFKAGAVFLPIDSKAPAERLEYMLTDSSAGFLLITGPAPEKQNKPSHWRGKILRFHSLCTPAIEKTATPYSSTSLDRHGDIAYIIYTSGSTGKPKGVVSTHRNVCPLLHWALDYRMGPGDRTLQNLSYFFDWCLYEIIITLMTGATLCIPHPETIMDPAAAVAFIHRHDITVLHITPTQLQYFLKDKNGLYSLKYLFIGAEKLSLSLVRQCYPKTTPDCRIFNMYGPTEAAIISSTLEVRRSEENLYRRLTSIPIGPPASNTRLFIFNKHMNLCPIDVTGELYIAGDGLAHGYLNRPELTAERFVSPPGTGNMHTIITSNSTGANQRRFYPLSRGASRANRPGSTGTECVPIGADARLYKTGDLARWLETGDVEYLGRIDHQVKIRGFRIELGEIENRICEIKEIKEAIVIAREHENIGQYLCAYIAFNPSTKTAIPAIRQYLAGYLPEYMIPSYFVTLDTMPLNPNKKVDRKRLPPPEVSETGTYEAPRDEIQKKLVRLWAGELGIAEDKIGITDNFFHLGGHSLTATRLTAAIHKEMGVRVPLPEIFVTPSIKGLAQFIKKAAPQRFSAIEPLEKKEFYPLSAAQKRLYILQQMENGSTAYNMPSLWRVQGNLDASALEYTFQHLIQRHESLRTSFHLLDGQPVQRVRDHVSFSLEEIAPGDATAPIKHIARPFDLSQAPLLRVSLGHSGNTHLLTLDMHHIISDGASMTLLIREAAAVLQGKELTAITVQYKDYAAWQQSAAQQDYIARQGSYWLDEFADNPPVLDLPTDFPRPTVQQFEGRYITFETDQSLGRRMIQFAAARDVTLFMLQMSVYTVLLSKLSGQRDITVGAPVTGRAHAGLQSVTGMFVNTLAMRHFPADDLSFEKYLDLVKKRAVNAFEHSDYPFEELVDHIQTGRDAGRNPLFDTMFTFHENANETIKLPGLTISPLNEETGIAKFDLSLICRQNNESFSFTLEYATALFTEKTVKSWARYYRKILESVLYSPDQKLRDIEIISDEEKKLILEEWNATAADYPHQKTNHQLFEEQAARTPDCIACSVSASNETLSYGQLNRKANSLAQALIRRGVTGDSVIALKAEPRLPLLIGIFGILKAGGAYLPIDPGTPEKRAGYILKDSNAHMLLTASDIEELTASPDPDQTVESPEVHAWNLAYVIYTSGSTGRPKGVAVEHRQLVNFIYHMYRRCDEQIGRNDRCLGNTNIMFDVSVWEFFLPLLSGARLVLMPDQRFDIFALARTIIEQRITMTYIPPGLLKPLNELLMQRRSEVYLDKMLVGVEPIRDDVLEEYMRLNPDMKLINAYGPTETTICATSINYRSHTPTGEIVPIGKPLSNNQVYLLDSAGNLVPPGIPGEIYISGHGVARGYLNNPELTAERFMPSATKTLFTPRRGGPLRNDSNSGKGIDSTYTTSDICRNPLHGGRVLNSQKLLIRNNTAESPLERCVYYRTGDIAVWLPGGNLRFIGRRDQQVKIRGYRIELGEIENRLTIHPGVKQALVIANSHESAGKYLCAYIVPQSSLDIEELKTHLAADLPEYMIPSYFVELDSIPLTPNGKADRRALPQPEINRQKHGITAPSDPVEKDIAALWGDILGIHTEKISVFDDFFQAGGNSLAATNLVSQLHKLLEVKIPLAQFFVTPTIRGLALLVKQSRKVLHNAIQPVEKKEFYPLSPAQKRMFLLQQLDTGSTAYNMPMSIRLDGNVDKQRLEQVFHRLIQHHESLRTSFHMIANEPVQRVHDQAAFAIEYISSVSPITPINNSSQPFDLSKAPLLRAQLAGNVLLIDIHHIISDGVSQAILEKQFNALYYEEHFQLPPLNLQYKDYACWHTGAEQQARVRRQKMYWLELFSGNMPALNLPTDFPRPTVQGFEGYIVEFVLDHKPAAALKKLALNTGATLFMVLTAILNIFLSKLSGQEDIVIGTATAGRSHADLSAIIGMFVNTIPLRLNPKPNITLQQFLGQVKTLTLNAFENQDYPFEELVDALNLRKDTGRNPVFDVMFNLLEQENNDSNPAVEEEIVHRESTSKFDLTLSALDTGSQLLLAFQYRADLFKPASIERFITYFKNIVAGSSQTSLTIGEIDMLAPEERQKLLFEFNNTHGEYPGDKSIPQIFNEQVERFPRRIAIVSRSDGKNRTNRIIGTDNKIYLSYKELDRLTGNLASLLRERGAGPGTILAIKIQRSLEMVAGILAILKTGAAYLPIDPNLPEERVSYMLSDSAALYVPDLDPLCRQSGKATGDDFTPSHIRPDQPAYIIYTSGSTGLPKGTVIHHRAVVNLLDGLHKKYPFKKDDVFLLKTSYAFDVSVPELFTWFKGGGKLAVLEPAAEKDPHGLIRAIETGRVSHINFVPSMFSLFIDTLEHDPASISKLSSLKYIFLAGEALPPTSVQRFQRLDTHVALENIYGPTESTVYASAYSLSQWSGGNTVPIGKPLQNIRLFILDRHLHIQPIGVTGELCIAGEGLARGYLNRPELTAQKFISYKQISNPSSQTPSSLFPLYRTGDLARWLEDGNIQFLGRMDHQIKIRGFRVEMGEIENRLMEHSAITEALVIDRKENDRHYLCAYYCGKEQIPVHHLKEHLEGLLPGYMIPACFVKLETIPLNANGKIDRMKCPRPLDSDFHGRSAYQPPQNDLQQLLVNIWQEVLGRDKIGIQDNIFDLGGNSLDLVKISNLLNEKINRRIATVTLFTYPTIRSLEIHLMKENKTVQNKAAPNKEAQAAQEKQKQELESDRSQLIDEGMDMMRQTLLLIDDED